MRGDVLLGKNKVVVLFSIFVMLFGSFVVIKNIHNKSIASQGNKVKELIDNLESVTADKLSAQKKYLNAIKNDLPWYLEWKDGILWWDKKRVTKKAYDKSNKEFNKLFDEYESKSDKTESKNDKNKIKMFIIIVAIILFLLFVLPMLFKNKENDTDDLDCSNEPSDSADLRSIHVTVPEKYVSNDKIKKNSKENVREDLHFETMDLTPLIIDEDDD